MRPQVTVRVEANEGGEMLRSYVTALLHPLVRSCDVHIGALVVTTPAVTAEDAVGRVLTLCDEWDALSKGETRTTARIRAALRTET